MSSRHDVEARPHDAALLGDHDAIAAPHWLHDLLAAALIGAAFTGVAFANYHLLVWLNP